MGPQVDAYAQTHQPDALKQIFGACQLHVQFID